MKWRVLQMDFRETAKKYIKKQRQVKCCACGKDLYSCDDFECSKSVKNYVFIHKNCLKFRGGKNG